MKKILAKIMTMFILDKMKRKERRQELILGYRSIYQAYNAFVM